MALGNWCNVALCLPAFYLFECDCIKLVVSSSKHAADQGTWVKGLTFSHSQQQDDPHPRLHPRHGGWAGCFPAITLSHQTALLTIQPARRVEPLRCAAFEPLCRTDRPSGSWGWWWGLLAEAQKTHMRVGIADRKVLRIALKSVLDGHPDRLKNFGEIINCPDIVWKVSGQAQKVSG